MALNIRPIITKDLNAVLSMAVRMQQEAPRYRDMPFIIPKAVAVINRLIEQGGGFVAEKDGNIIGMVGGIITEHFFNHEKFSVDFAVYVEPEHRGGSTVVRLVDTYEKWAQAQGVREISLGVSTGLEQEKTVCIYQKLGYKIASYTLIKQKD